MCIERGTPSTHGFECISQIEHEHAEVYWLYASLCPHAREGSHSACFSKYETLVHGHQVCEAAVSDHDDLHQPENLHGCLPGDLHSHAWTVFWLLRNEHFYGKKSSLAMPQHGTHCFAKALLYVEQTERLKQSPAPRGLSEWVTCRKDATVRPVALILTWWRHDRDKLRASSESRHCGTCSHH